MSSEIHLSLDASDLDSLDANDRDLRDASDRGSLDASDLYRVAIDERRFHIESRWKSAISSIAQIKSNKVGRSRFLY